MILPARRRESLLEDNVSIISISQDIENVTRNMSAEIVFSFHHFDIVGISYLKYDLIACWHQSSILPMADQKKDERVK